MNQFSNNYDLEERTAKLGESVISMCRSIKQDAISRPLISQLVRSATSVGANYMEANGASSRRDFRNKIFICKRECQETKHWLRMLSSSINDQDIQERNRTLWKEAQELTLIFQKITTTLNKPAKVIEN